MGGLWSFLSTSKNQKTLSWIGGGLVVVAGGAWALFAYLWPHEASSPKARRSCARSRAESRPGATRTATPLLSTASVQVAAEATTPCVDTGKPQ